jgi:glycine cleavage system aminomethyltransferase T
VRDDLALIAVQGPQAKEKARLPYSLLNKKTRLKA